MAHVTNSSTHCTHIYFVFDIERYDLYNLNSFVGEQKSSIFREICFYINTSISSSVVELGRIKYEEKYNSIDENAISLKT